MQKLLISLLCGASLLSGCSSMRESMREVSDSIPNALDKMPLIYRQDIQQGNVVSQEMVNSLRPGMTKSQVRYIMGTPLLVDVFHQDRWDYLYSMQEGKDPRNQERVALYFQDGRLMRIEGDLRPLPTDAMAEEEKETVISVPDYTPQSKGIFTRAMEAVGLESDD
jgi:outer membrane protein assembly factor BamE